MGAFDRGTLGAFYHVAYVLLPSDKFCIMKIKYTVKLGCGEVRGTQRKLRLIRYFDTSVNSFAFRFTRCLLVKLTSGLTCATYSLRLRMHDFFQV